MVAQGKTYSGRWGSHMQTLNYIFSNTELHSPNRLISNSAKCCLEVAKMVHIHYTILYIL